MTIVIEKRLAQQSGSSGKERISSPLVNAGTIHVIVASNPRPILKVSLNDENQDHVENICILSRCLIPIYESFTAGKNSFLNPWEE